MGKKPQHETFAELVKALDRQEVSSTKPRRPGLYGRDQLVDREGHTYTRVAAVSAEQAQELAKAGARVVYDPCGCGGYCGMTWFDRESVQRLAAAGPPVMGRKRGWISHWRAEGGEAYLLVEDDVRWGDLLD
ncbi:MAG: hypothetical protein ACLGIA_13960 [Actinomycetes bacterium]